MARNPDLEDLLAAELSGQPGLTTKTMFGGLAWMQHGHLLCGARDDGMLVRLGKGNDGWALELPEVNPLQSGGRPLSGWIRAGAAIYGDDALRRKLISQALAFVATLPPKSK